MRWLRPIGVILVVLVVLAAGVLLWYRQASQPDHEGRVVVQGIAAPIEVRRDDSGVPTIFAGSEGDALFALGFAHAQDRLWQIDFNRRIAQGRLAELLGSKALEADKFLRTLGVYRTAQQIARNLDPDTRALVDAYAAGINAALAARSGPLPPEFVLTRAPAPAPWTAADSIAWAMMMAWDLSSMSYRNELSRLRLALKFSKAEIDEFRPPYPGETALPTTDYVELYRRLGLRATTTAAFQQALSQLAREQTSAGFGDGEGIGSNNWVVSGSRTTSGFPLLANDPHLGLSTPSVWYFAQLHAPGLDVFGATLPGVPYVLLGRNRHVAWGFTNTGSDLQDLYLEQLDPDDSNRYKTPDGYASFATRSETISVRGAEAVTLMIRETRHGPVLSGAAAAVDQALVANKSQFVLSLRWTALEPVDHALRAIRNMNRAHSASEFAAALRDWTLVQQNIGFADDHGDIGMIAPGRVPVRGPDNDLAGLAPAPGWEPKYDWQGWLPFEQMPKVMNPASGMIVTANQKITPPGYQPYLTSEWFLPYRADRITQLLSATPRHDVASMTRIQADVVSLAAQDQLAALRALVPPLAPETAAGQLALARLGAWDGSMRADAPEPLLWHAWLRRLRLRIFADDLGDLADEMVAGNERTLATLNVLRGATHARDWCDDRTTVRVETCSEIACAALDEAVAELAQQGGRDVLGLRWGEAHQVRNEHRPLSNVAWLRPWVELSAPAPGDSFTINVGQLSLAKDAPYATRHAASLRAVYDLAPGGGGAWNFPTGEDGHPLSDHYGDLFEAWRRVELTPMRWQSQTQESHPGLLLQLMPKGATKSP